MNLEELKTAWQVYDKKIQAVKSINEKLIETMIKERSVSRVSVIKRQYHGFFILMAVEIIVLLAILAGNPFDFKYQWQFVPYGLLIAGIIVAFFNLLTLYRKITRALYNCSVGVFLKNILEMYEQNKIFEKWFGIIFLSVGFIIPLSFLPQKIEKNGIASSIIETAIMMGVTLLIYFVAVKLGAFKNRNEEKFRNDLAELNELKSMSLELSEDENN